MAGETELFERTMLPLLDDAYTLARYLMRDEHDAQDVVQEAYLRAWRHFGGYRGGDARAWMLTIVRHCCATWRRAERRRGELIEYSESEHGRVTDARLATDAVALEQSERAAVDRALDHLPNEFREVLVLREVEQLSYTEIARVIGAPVGTVMSRLARARQRMRDAMRTGAQEAS